MNPTISILIAVHNGAATLDRALQSIFEQTYPGYEIVIVDDASIDATASILKAWQNTFSPERFHVITNPQKNGQTKSLITGWQETRGTWIARLDADDWWEKDKLRQQMLWLSQNPRIGLLGTAYINHMGKKAYLRRPPLTNQKIRRRIWWRNPFGHSCVLVRRELMERVGGYDPAIQYGQDLDLWFRLLPHTHCANLSATLCHRTVTRNEGKQRHQMRQTLRTLARYAKKYRPSLSSYLGFLEPALLLSSRWLLPALILVFFAILQISFLNYGTLINDRPHIRHAPVDATTLILEHAELQRDALVSSPTGTEPVPSLDQALVRFKLYSVDADEMVNLMALSRINPREKQFDPHFYMYGGAYLYPLGAYYALLNQTGILALPSLDTLLTKPTLVDQLYIFGRLFVLTATIISAVVLFLTARLFLPVLTATLALALFLFFPLTITNSVVMKPHWYALVFAAVTLFYLTRLWQNKKWSLLPEIMMGLSLGLAVGSATTYTPFAIGIWLTLAYLRWRQKVSMRPLIIIPLIVLATFVVTNPYIIINYAAWQIENAELASWYQPAFNVSTLSAFMQNSLIPAFGAAATAAALISLIMSLRHRSAIGMLTGLAILSAILLAAVSTSSVSFWHTNARFIPYLAPVLALYLATHLPTRWLALVVALTLIQAAPHISSLADENNPRYSTRLRAADWIEHNIPPNQSICAQLVPYDTAPFDFTRYTLNTDPCRYIVRVEREHPVTNPESTKLIQHFSPRFTNPYIPLVTNHINPRISIYENLATH